MKVMNTFFQNHQINISKQEKLNELKKDCKAYEAEILNFFLKEAMDTKNPLFPETPGEKIYKSMQIETLSKELSGNFGYSELLFNYLKEKV